MSALVLLKSEKKIKCTLNPPLVRAYFIVSENCFNTKAEKGHKIQFQGKYLIFRHENTLVETCFPEALQISDRKGHRNNTITLVPRF